MVRCRIDKYLIGPCDPSQGLIYYKGVTTMDDDDKTMMDDTDDTTVEDVQPTTTRKGSKQPYDGSTPLSNPQWESFALAYIGSGCQATQAASEAGYSPSNAAKQGAVLSVNPVIRARIAHLGVELGGLDSLAAARLQLIRNLQGINDGDKMGTARVAAGRELKEIFGLGEGASRARTAEAKIELLREANKLQRELVELAKSGHNVTVQVQYGNGKSKTTEG